MVVVHHLLLQLARHGSGDLRATIGIGQAGVDVFFVISGFIMVYITSRRSLHSRQFWLDRAVRILPLYWVFTLLMMAVIALLPSLLHTAVLDVEHFLKSLLLIPDFHPTRTEQIWPLLVQGWTLQYEMLFYFVFGLFLILRSVHTRLICVTFVLLSLVSVGSLSDTANPIFIVGTNPLLIEFLAGSWIGYLYLTDKLPSARLGPIFLLLAITLFGLSDVFAEEFFFRAVSWGLPSLFLLVSFLILERKVGVFRSRFLLGLGDSSYSLYLSHTFVLGFVGYLWGAYSTRNAFEDVAFSLLAISLCLAFGHLSFCYLEEPLCRWCKQWAGSQSTR